MSDHASTGRSGADETTPFDQLIADSTKPAPSSSSSFATSFRGYDKDEVDAELRSLRARLNSAEDQVNSLKQNQRRAGAAVTHSREKIEKLEADLAAAEERRVEAVENLEAAVAAAVEHDRDAVER
ncbi:MAG: DivIVA domain-containing protein, partial [Microbacterium sp.]